MRLTADHRAALVLRHFHGLSYADMAQVLDLPEKTVKSRLFEARRSLRAMMLERGLLP
jgi:RNA polymerase sigma-70 factor (ECF subfamily)